MVADNVLDPTLCHDLISFVDNHPHLCEIGRTSYGVEESVKKTYDCFISPQNEFVGEDDLKRDELNVLQRRIFEAFTASLSTYISFYDDLVRHWDQPLDTGYKFQRYLPNEGFFAPHVDGGTYHTFPSCERILGVVMYLNTVQEGGATRLDLHDAEVSPVEGRVLLFPSNYNFIHTATIPVSNRKDIISTFCLSKWR